MHGNSPGVLVCWDNVQLFSVPPLMRPQLLAAHLSWWECVECFHIPSVLPAPIMVYYKNTVIDERPGAAAVWHIDAIEFDTKELVQFLHDDERAVVGF